MENVTAIQGNVVSNYTEDDETLVMESIRRNIEEPHPTACTSRTDCELGGCLFLLSQAGIYMNFLHDTRIQGSLSETVRKEI